MPVNTLGLYLGLPGLGGPQRLAVPKLQRLRARQRSLTRAVAAVRPKWTVGFGGSGSLPWRRSSGLGVVGVEVPLGWGWCVCVWAGRVLF